jgi:hypothetical protein
MEEDKPIPRGGYDLSKLDEMDAFGGGAFGAPTTVPKK